MTRAKKTLLLLSFALLIFTMRIPAVAQQPLPGKLPANVAGQWTLSTKGWNGEVHTQYLSTSSFAQILAIRLSSGEESRAIRSTGRSATEAEWVNSTRGARIRILRSGPGSSALGRQETIAEPAAKAYLISGVQTMIKKDLFIGIALGAVLGCAGIIVAQAPVVNIDPHRHGNLSAAQGYIVDAYKRIQMAQSANDSQLGGHAQKAKNYLVQADQELRLAADVANAEGR
jgi:hypothetical protein